MVLRHCAVREGELLTFLRRELELSSSLTSRLKFQNAYYVNGKPAHTNCRIRPGDEITVYLEEPQPDYPAQQGPLSILYEDEALLALDKPAGVMVHPSFHRNTETLANYLLGYYAQTGQHCAVHPVTRLDRDTFGVVLIAKNAHIHARLCQALRGGKLQKRYHALVFGGPAEDCGEIDAPIARSAPQSLLRCVREDGQPALSRFRVLARAECCALLELEPVTGRTHQLRVHCAFSGMPILGDPQYATEDSRVFSAGCGYSYQQLCAVQLTLPHPITGEAVTIWSRQKVLLPPDRP